MMFKCLLLFALLCVQYSFSALIKDLKDKFRLDIKLHDYNSNNLIKFGEKIFVKHGGEECDIIWQEIEKPHCSTTYEQVCTEEHVEQCSTEYEQQCTMEYKDQCSVHQDKECWDEPSQECSTVYDEKCWTEEKEDCVTEPKCTTVYDNKCTTSHKTICASEGYGKSRGKRSAGLLGLLGLSKKYGGEENCWMVPETSCRMLPKPHAPTNSGYNLAEPAYAPAFSLKHKRDTTITNQYMKMTGGHQKCHTVYKTVCQDSTGGVKSRGKRSLSSGVAGLLDIIKKKKGEQDECWEVPETHCAKVPISKCHDEKKCWPVPFKQCSKEPRQECWTVNKQQCKVTPRKECHQVPNQVCNQVPHQKCWTEPQQKCWNEPKKHCTTITAKAAKRVCADDKKW